MTAFETLYVEYIWVFDPPQRARKGDGVRFAPRGVPQRHARVRLAGHGERSRLELLFKLGGTENASENLSILAVNTLAVNALAVNNVS